MGLGYVDILSKAATKISTTLTSYTKIYNVFNLEKEPKARLDAGYGVKFGRMYEQPDVTRHFTSRGELIVILTNSITYAGDKQSEVGDLYTDIESVIRAFRDGSNLGSSVIMDVGKYNLSEPVLIKGTEHVMVEITFDVLFRESF